MHRKICFLLCLFLLPFLLLSCGEKKDFLEVLNGDFVCRAEGTVGGKPFSATVYASGRMIYNSPSDLCGIIASEDGKTLTLDGMSLTAKSLIGFFVPARLLTDQFEVSGVGTEKRSECYVDCVNEHGTRRVYVSADGTPRRVTGSFGGISADFEIVDFEKNEGDEEND